MEAKVKKFMLLLATAVSAGGFSLWAQVDEVAPFPKEL
jgi:hypothetical protein